MHWLWLLGAIIVLQGCAAVEPAKPETDDNYLKMTCAIVGRTNISFKGDDRVFPGITVICEKEKL